MTHGKRRDICTAIRTKHEGTIQKLWAFIATLQVPPLSVPVAAFSLYVWFVALFRPCVRHSSSPSFALDIPSSRLTTLPSLFEPRRTVYKVALLNWKPQLCRCCSHPLLFHLACFFPTATEPPSVPPFLSASSPVQARPMVRMDRC